MEKTEEISKEWLYRGIYQAFFLLKKYFWWKWVYFIWLTIIA